MMITYSLKTYKMIGGEIIDYNSDLDLPTYENILFGKKVNIPTSLYFNRHKKVETKLEVKYIEFKRKISLLYHNLNLFQVVGISLSDYRTLTLVFF